MAHNFWHGFVTWWNAMNFSNLYPLVEENILLGFPCISNEDVVLNFCIILSKYYMFMSKLNQNQIIFLNFLKILKNKLVVEEAIQTKKLSLNKFYDIWRYLFEQL